MFVPFNEMPSSARLWVYTADQPLSSEEVSLISKKMDDFTGSWESHQQPLKASWQLEHNTFLLVAVDEQFHNASGCSIDKSVQVLKEIEQATGRNFFRRDLVYYKNEKGSIEQAALPQLKGLAESSKINDYTLVFNTLIDNLAALQTQWLVPASSTWLQRYLKTVSH